MTSGWLAPQQQISSPFGLANVWAGDTFGLSTLGSSHIAVSWGSAVATKKSDIYATTVGY